MSEYTLGYMTDGGKVLLLVFHSLDAAKHPTMHRTSPSPCPAPCQKIQMSMVQLLRNPNPLFLCLCLPSFLLVSLLFPLVLYRQTAEHSKNHKILLFHIFVIYSVTDNHLLLLN